MATSIAPARPSIRSIAPLRATRCAEHDVRREEDGIRERERDADRLPLETDVDERVDARDGEDERGEVAGRAGAERGEHDHRQELDRGHRAEGQPVDGDVEAGVHDGEDDAEGEHEPPDVPPATAHCPPWTPPRREHGARARDPQPRDPERVDAREEQHREGRPEVVEDRADDEERLRGGGGNTLADPARQAPSWHV